MDVSYQLADEMKIWTALIRGNNSYGETVSNVRLLRKQELCEDEKQISNFYLDVALSPMIKDTTICFALGNSSGARESKRKFLRLIRQKR